MPKNKDVRKHVIWIFVLSLAGTLFAGTLSFFKLFTESCALSEGCAYFLGLPTCYYGFVIYLTLLILSSIMMFNRSKGNSSGLINGIFYVVLAGMLFAGYFTYLDIFFPACIGECSYTLLLPSCVYGFIMYIVIFLLSIFALKKMK